MVHCCCVPRCSHRSDREHHLSYFGLPLKIKSILKQWVHRIGRKNLPINYYTRVCSSHFVQAAGRRLQPDEVPSLNLLVLTSVARSTPRRPPKERAFQSMCHDVLIQKQKTVALLQGTPLLKWKTFLRMRQKES